MRSLLKPVILGLGLLLYCGKSLHAADQAPDTASLNAAILPDTLEDDAEYDETAESESDEGYDMERTPRTVIYSSQRPTEARWLEVTSDDEYSYRTIREYVPRPVKQEPPREIPWWIRALGAVMRFFATTAGKIILLVLLVAIVGYVVYRIIGGEGRLFGKRDIRQPAASDGGELSEEGLMELNWETRMREAVSSGDHRQAIRFGYLHLLQQLQARQQIHFRPDKTNIAYYRELPEQLRPGFRSLTRAYEFAWYGNYIPDAAGMSAYVSELEQFLQTAPRQ